MKSNRIKKPGDIVQPLSLWNRTLRKYNTIHACDEHLEDSVTVIRCNENAKSQTGVTYTVLTTVGKELTLDSDWFIHKD